MERLDTLRELIAHFNELELKLTALEQARAMYMQSIQKQVKDLGSASRTTVSLEALLTESEEVATANERIRQQREASNTSIRNLEQQRITKRTEQQTACEELEAWNTKWADAVRALGLTGDALPQEAADVIDKFRDLFAKQSDAEKLQIRINAIDSDARSFQQQSVALAARVAPELQTLPADASATRLNALLSDNKDRQSQRQQIDTQLKEAREDKQSAEYTAKTMKARLDTLCREARCANPTELEEAERLSDEKRQLEKDLANLEQSILDSGEGSTLTELLAEAQEVDADGLPASIQTLTHTIDDELEPTRTTLAETKGGLAKERELMDGSDQAAALADQDQLVLAEIRSDSERYIRLKLAARILRDEIERYREENQGPLIERASEHFSALTLGSFEALHTDFNDKDEPLLVGVRSNREKVRVEGMSSGTRDQLHLALRLASLEKYMESTEPMPFIVDDILVDFDDERSQAALNALALLSRKTQVVLFTHHSSVVEQARTLKPAHANIYSL